MINDNQMSISGNVGFINEYLKIVRKYGNELSFLDIDHSRGYRVDIVVAFRKLKHSLAEYLTISLFFRFFAYAVVISVTHTKYLRVDFRILTR